MSSKVPTSSASVDHSLTRRTSKSRLLKQAGVEAEDPPASDRTKPHIPETRVESCDVLLEDNAEASALGSKVVTITRSQALHTGDEYRLNAPSGDKQLSKAPSSTSSLSRDSSTELYTDSTGVNLTDFIVNTLHKNPKDRQMLLQLEEEMIRFVQDAGKQVLRFPPMSSYNRMLVHRTAAFFGLDHNVDQTGHAVVVNKTDATRLPDARFRDHIKSDVYNDESKRMVLRRNIHSHEEVEEDFYLEGRKSRSFEDRDYDAERAPRPRIVNQDSTSSDVGPEFSASRNTDVKRLSVLGASSRPWSSTDSGYQDHSSSTHRVTRGSLSASHKAGSFGGLSAAYRSGPRRSNTDAGRGSGGDLSRPHSGLDGSYYGYPHQQTLPLLVPGQEVIFAVANWENVPAGAMLINPQTGQPYVNADGSLYRHLPPYSNSPTIAPYMHQTFVHQDQSGICGGLQSLSLQIPMSPPQPAADVRSPNPLYTPPASAPPQQVLAYMVHRPTCGSESVGYPSPNAQQPVLLQLQPYTNVAYTYPAQPQPVCSPPVPADSPNTQIAYVMCNCPPLIQEPQDGQNPQPSTAYEPDNAETKPSSDCNPVPPDAAAGSPRQDAPPAT